MHGWTGRVLRIDLTKQKIFVQNLDPSILTEYIGGRGLAIRILWDEVPQGVDPLSPYNKLIIAGGPLTGLPIPSSGKLVVASKSPLTGGYGDGNIGSKAAVMLRRAGYDAIVIEGRSAKPVYLVIEDDKVSIEDARDLWGLDAFTAEKELTKLYGRDTGILLIGPAGENMVRFATIVSMGGRSGGRPGMGAVMGSKMLKAIVIKGSKDIPVYDPKGLKEVAEKAYSEILSKPNYELWIRQGTMATIEWAQANSVLPTMNFREGMFDEYEKISGSFMERIKVRRRGCPYCNMQCGNVVIDYEGMECELDYENVAMLGSNILLGDLRKVAVLNRLADMYGLDTISMGNVIAFLMEASEKKLIDEKIEWGDFDKARMIIEDTAFRRGIGALAAEGVMRISKYLRGGSEDWAMHVKGLEITAYDCHAAPGMALAYATSPIGAHHKDAWLIGVEVKMDRAAYSIEKVEKLIEFQRIRGGIFEVLTVCRLPWIELKLDLDYYVKLFNAATGLKYTVSEFYTIADRIYALIRAFWIREYGHWSSLYDYPPMRWFKEPLTKGPFKGWKLDLDKYSAFLKIYYDKRGWDHNGVPKESTLKTLGLSGVIPVLRSII